MNVFNLSFGKDKCRHTILAAEQGIPIDRVMYCDIRFSPEISGEHPIMAEWIPKAEDRLKELFGITVDHAYSGVSFVEQFYKTIQKGKMKGFNYGFPYIIAPWCNDRLKMKAVQKYNSQFKQQVTSFCGIAYDEPIRWQRMLAKETKTHKYRSLLVEQKLIEANAFEICKKYDLLSPIYSVDGIYRGGCWFCPKQCLADLYSLWKNYPDLFSKLEEMEKDSHVSFKPNKTLKDFRERFEAGYIPKRKKRKTFQQLSLFDY